MKSRKVVYLFFSTLIIGTFAGSLIGFILDWSAHISDLSAALFGGVIVVVITAAIWTVVAQMGFFAYLMIHRLGLGIFRSAKLWNKVQAVFIAFVLIDLMLIRHMFFVKEGESMLTYAILPLLLLVYALVVAWIKSQDTNKLAFIPTVFLMVVVTIIEWIPALRENESVFLMAAIVPLLVANTWQVLVLHRLHEPKANKGVITKSEMGTEGSPQPLS